MLKTLQELIAETTAHVRTADSVTAKKEFTANGGYLIDVREPAEVKQQSPRGSHNIPRGVLEMKIPALCPEETSPLYVHCASGGRARLAADQLIRMGYQNVTAVTCSIEKVCQAFENE